MDKEKLNEALSRMEILGIPQERIEAFRDQGEIPVTEMGSPAPAAEATMARIREIEEDFGVLVYAASCRPDPAGRLETFLYVGEPEEWESERRGLERGETFAYVSNVAFPVYSGFRLVGMRDEKGALSRAW